MSEGDRWVGKGLRELYLSVHLDSCRYRGFGLSTNWAAGERVICNCGLDDAIRAELEARTVERELDPCGLYAEPYDR